MPKSVLEVGLLPDNRASIRQTPCDTGRYSVVKWQVEDQTYTRFAPHSPSKAA